MTVESIVTGVCFASGKPSVKRRVGIVEHPVPFRVPVEIFRGIRPELFRVVN
jgi:hypothetical protein